MTLSIALDKEDLAEARRMLLNFDNGFPKAFSRALNKTVTNTKTEMTDLIRADYNYTLASLRSRITTRNSTVKTLFAKVTSTGRSPHLTDIVGTRGTKTRGISVDVKKATGRRYIPQGFLAIGRVSGKKISFIRKMEGGRRVARLPLEDIRASHPEVVYNTKENWAKIQAAVKIRLDNNFLHEVDVILKGIA